MEDGIEAQIVKNVLSRYKKLSGQANNLNKSGVYFSPNTKVQERHEVCGYFKYTKCTNHENT